MCMAVCVVWTGRHQSNCLLSVTRSYCSVVQWFSVCVRDYLYWARLACLWRVCQLHLVLSDYICLMYSSCLVTSFGDVGWCVWTLHVYAEQHSRMQMSCVQLLGGYVNALLVPHFSAGHVNCTRVIVSNTTLWAILISPAWLRQLLKVSWYPRDMDSATPDVTVTWMHCLFQGVSDWCEYCHFCLQQVLSLVHMTYWQVVRCLSEIDLNMHQITFHHQYCASILE